VAREILNSLGAGEEMISEVCDIISHHHHPRAGDSVNFKCLYDADRLVNLEENLKEGPLSKEKLSSMLEHFFLTGSGLRIARELFLPQVKEQTETEK
jgi:hypothetical protein